MSEDKENPERLRERLYVVVRKNENNFGDAFYGLRRL